MVGSKISVWDPSDVLLVVEVSDETVLSDLNTKAKLYARAGYAVYWVVTKDMIYEHTEPSPDGYLTSHKYRPGTRIPVNYADTTIAVDDLLFSA